MVELRRLAADAGGGGAEAPGVTASPPRAATAAKTYQAIVQGGSGDGRAGNYGWVDAGCSQVRERVTSSAPGRRRTRAHDDQSIVTTSIPETMRAGLSSTGVVALGHSVERMPKTGS